MSRFDLFSAGDGTTYLLDLQSDFLESYITRVAAPVVPLEAFPLPAKDLNPVIRIGDMDYVVQTHFMAAVPAVALKNRVGSLADHADEITRALDILFQGY